MKHQLVFSSVIIFLFVSCAFADHDDLFSSSPIDQQIWISASDGNDSNEGTMSSPFLTLSRALSVASSSLVIFVEPGTYSGAGNQLLQLQSNRSVALLAANASFPLRPRFDLGFTSSFLSQDPFSTLLVANIDFTQGWIDAFQESNLSASLFAVNQASLSLSNVSLSASASPMIFLSNSSASIVGCSFSLPLPSSFSSSSSSFSSSSAFLLLGSFLRASAVPSSLSMLSIHTSSFVGAYCETDANATGCAVAVQGYTSVSLDAVDFSDNVLNATSHGSGAALSLVGCTATTIARSGFFNNSITLFCDPLLPNHAFAFGASLFSFSSPTGGSISIDRSSFSGNVIRSQGICASLEMHGGAASLSHASSIQVSDCTFHDNSLAPSASGVFSGGALSIDNATVAMLQSSGFSRNAILFSSFSCASTTRTLINGSAVSAEGPLDVANCTFFEHLIWNEETLNRQICITQVYGGVVRISWGSIVDCSFVSSLLTTESPYIVDIWGYVVYALSPFLISGCTFEKNLLQGTLDGVFGIIFQDHDQLLVDSCRFANTHLVVSFSGTSNNPPGGLFLSSIEQPNPLVIQNCIFSNLSFTLHTVSALFYSDNGITLFNTSFSGITVVAPYETGFNFIISNSLLLISDCVFEDIELDLQSQIIQSRLISTSVGPLWVNNSAIRRLLIYPPLKSTTIALIMYSEIPWAKQYLVLKHFQLTDVQVLYSVDPHATPAKLNGLISILSPSASFSRSGVSIADSVFSNILISGAFTFQGGIFYGLGSAALHVEFTDCEFSDLNFLPFQNLGMQSPNVGAVMFIESAITLLINRSSFHDNYIQAPVTGSLVQVALGVLDADQLSVIAIQHSNFSRNTAIGLYCPADQSPSSTAVAVAITFQPKQILTSISIINCNFADNLASCGLGGSITVGCDRSSAPFVCRLANVELSSNSFFNSTSLRGGAISIDSSELNIFSSTFDYNQALGSGALACGEPDDDGLEMFGFGGAVFVNDSSVSISSSSFSNNSAAIGGGGVFSLFNSRFEVSSTNWKSNQAQRLGAAILLAPLLISSESTNSIGSSNFSLHANLAPVITVASTGTTLAALSVTKSHFYQCSGARSVSGVFGLAIKMQPYSEMTCTTSANFNIDSGPIFSISTVQSTMVDCYEVPAMISVLSPAADATSLAGEVIDAIVSTDPICALSQAVFSPNQLDTMFLSAVPVFDGVTDPHFDVNFTSIILINNSYVRIPFSLTIATTWVLSIRDTLPCSSLTAPLIPFLVFPSCLSSNECSLSGDIHTLMIPCAASDGLISISGKDQYGNPIVSSDPSCAEPVVEFVDISGRWPSFFGETSWNQTLELYQVEYVAQHGGYYQLFVSIGNSSLPDSPYAATFIQPQGSVSTVSCLPLVNSSFFENTEVMCYIEYLDSRNLTVDSCLDTILCTTIGILYQQEATNISVDSFHCTSESSASFQWQIRTAGAYTVQVSLPTGPLTPFPVEAFAVHSGHNSWWHKYHWYVVGFSGLIALIIIAGIAGLLYYFHSRRNDLENRYQLLGTDFMDIPESGKFFFTLLSVLDDPSINKIIWKDIVMSNDRTSNISSSETSGDPLIAPLSTSTSIITPTTSSSSSSSSSSQEANLLGSGAAGKVRKGRWGEVMVAVKQIYIVPVPGEDYDSDVNDFFMEIKTLSCLNHPNILRFLGVSVVSAETNELALITELMECSLEKIIFSPIKYPELTVKHKIQWAIDVARGLQYLHHCNPPIIHRDIKPENVLISSAGVLKLADFGVSTFKPRVSRNMTQRVGSPNYFAPEVFNSQDYTESCDIYSYGVVLVEIFSGMRAYDYPKFRDLGIAQLLYLVVNENLRPPISEDTPILIKSIILETFSSNPSFRPKASEIVNRILRVENSHA